MNSRNDAAIHASLAVRIRRYLWAIRAHAWATESYDEIRDQLGIARFSAADSHLHRTLREMVANEQIGESYGGSFYILDRDIDWLGTGTDPDAIW